MASKLYINSLFHLTPPTKELLGGQPQRKFTPSGYILKELKPDGTAILQDKDTKKLEEWGTSEEGTQPEHYSILINKKYYEFLTSLRS